ncbi:hypothetical protein BDK51DRAFT_29363 [Blyttiomyces helicus]|uniref:Uncharacterized protein n=1 Tax=Blyttiomyces helicus TaxID=388810 RepID=A0A4P9WN06_9FUNG|nr:hypothetical protein BDK51DRAFT_29363 [Blyttiomyces helicus]|eukprot:RKO94481.1 hypothetical protein BDK51DRAFT_29363 [Blyttiomyces helicus]
MPVMPTTSPNGNIPNEEEEDFLASASLAFRPTRVTEKTHLRHIEKHCSVWGDLMIAFPLSPSCSLQIVEAAACLEVGRRFVLNHESSFRFGIDKVLRKTKRSKEELKQREFFGAALDPYLSVRKSSKEGSEALDCAQYQNHAKYGAFKGGKAMEFHRHDHRWSITTADSSPASASPSSRKIPKDRFWRVSVEKDLSPLVVVGNLVEGGPGLGAGGLVPVLAWMREQKVVGEGGVGTGGCGKGTEPGMESKTDRDYHIRCAGSGSLDGESGYRLWWLATYSMAGRVLE